MSIEGRKAWELLVRELLKDQGETAGVTGIRAELCSQILNMSKKELFEFCQDLESMPGLLDKPERAMDCEMCHREFGICPGRFGDVDTELCEKRFWSCAEKSASDIAFNKIHGQSA